MLPFPSWAVGSPRPSMSNTDLFTGPFFWVFAYMLVVGIGLVVWSAATTPGGAGSRRATRSVLLEELALGVAAFGLFWALVAN